MSPQPLPKDPIAEARRNWERRGWDEVAAPMAAVTAIMRVQQLLLARAQAVLKPFGLTFARYELLALLSFSRGRRLLMSKASALLQVHPTSVTNAVDRLEAAGLVERQPHESDRRALVLALTGEGRRVAEEATAALNEQVFAQTGFSTDDVDALNTILARFRAAAGDFDPAVRAADAGRSPGPTPEPPSAPPLPAPALPPQRGSSRTAPSSRMVSPFRNGLATICSTSNA